MFYLLVFFLSFELNFAELNLKESLPFYLEVQENLAKDDLELATASATKFLDFAEASEEKVIIASLKALARSSSLDRARTAFFALSKKLISLVESDHHLNLDNLYLAHCPMAMNDKGADWLQNGKQINNPYFGSEMLRCGSAKSLADDLETHHGDHHHHH